MKNQSIIFLILCSISMLHSETQNIAQPQSTPREKQTIHPPMRHLPEPNQIEIQEHTSEHPVRSKIQEAIQERLHKAFATE